jgi:hypothetical protein
MCRALSRAAPLPVHIKLSRQLTPLLSTSGDWLLLLRLAGVPELAGVECAADVMLAAAARLAGLMLRADGGLSMVRLAAGLAHGSCFLDYEGGAACKLCLACLWS